MANYVRERFHLKDKTASLPLGKKRLSMRENYATLKLQPFQIRWDYEFLLI